MGKIFIIGIGPGNHKFLTEQAKEALRQSDTICGYTLYLELVQDFCEGKKTFSTPMRGEIERCKKALELATNGETVSLVCSGDAGVYGMAAPVLKLTDQMEEIPEIEVVPGITAALSGAAVLGAPIGHDFCVISLSDLLTPWELIERRLKAAAMGDFAVALYNPSSKKRNQYLGQACRILMDAGKDPNTICGWVKNIGRDGECKKILSLKELSEESVDMFTTVFIGSSNTRNIQDYMVTPRGYRDE